MRRSRARSCPVFLALALLGFLGPRLSAMDAEAAWSAAAVMSKEAEAWKAGLMAMTVVEYGKDGQEKSKEESRYRVRYAADGQMESEIIIAMKNGKDVTEERRKELSSGKQRGWGRSGQGAEGGAMAFPQPFSPAEGDSMERGQPSAGVHSARAVWVFPFKYRVKGGMRWTGEVFLDKENGRPVAITLAAAGGIPGLKSMSMSGRYADQGQGGLLESAQMKVLGQFLLKRVDFSFTMAFSEYAPPAAGAERAVPGTGH